MERDFSGKKDFITIGAIKFTHSYKYNLICHSVGISTAIFYAFMHCLDPYRMTNCMVIKFKKIKLSHMKQLFVFIVLLIPDRWFCQKISLKFSQSFW